MRKIVSVHAPGGPGKAHLTANLAASVALLGKRVGVIETDTRPPGMLALFGLDPGQIVNTVGDHLAGRCELQDAAHRVSPPEVAGAGGSVYLIPAGPLDPAYDAERLGAALGPVLDALFLDFLFVDAPAGLGEGALLAAAAADWAVVMLRPDRQDYLTTAVAVEVVRRLGVPRVALVLNEVPLTLDHAALQQDLERTFGAELGAVLPPAGDGAPGLVAARQPEHPLARAVAGLAAKLVRA